MTDADALLAAILAEPDDDGPRLVYADWLEEHGKPERAEFVRVQLARAAQRPGQCVHGQCPDAAKCCEVWCEGADRLSRREGELFESFGVADERAALFGVPDWLYVDYEPGDVLVPWRGRALVRHGFIEEVRCPLADWLAHGPAVMRRQPVTRVDVTDKRPMQMRRMLGQFRDWWRWYRDHAYPVYSMADDLPPEVYDLLEGGERAPLNDRAWLFPTEAAARAALSAALISFAKRPAAVTPAAGAGR